jgi:nucleotide-binding universal stress UspA family protein
VLRAEIDARLPDVLVLGTRGLRGVERTFRGSVALDMLGASPCDVIAVPGH